MAYEIRKSDGTLLLELSDGFTDNTTSSLTFIGKNVSKFGEMQNNNLLHLLENFSALTEPANKITGQLWFDKTNNVIKVFNNDKWQTLSILTYSPSSAAASSVGNLWYDTINHQLSINTGTGFSLIGPESVPGFGVTKLVSTKLKDLSNVDHPVIEIVLNDEIIGIISSTNFDINSTNGLSGFPYAYKGITFRNSTTNEIQLYGWSKFADNANKLKNDLGDFVSASTTTVANSIVQRTASSGIAVADIIASSITTSTSGTISGTWTVNNGFNPDTNGGANLGTGALRWSNVYAQTVDASTVNATTVKFSNLTDVDLTSITRFDTDNTLAANSDSRLATQRAIKKYIDDAVTAEINNRTVADTTIQNQINGFESIPAGIVMYTAGVTVPTGFLALTGQTLSKNTYSRLYAAIGGVYGQTDTTFNLPDARGEFIRSWDHGRGVDTGRSLGTSQTEEFKSHGHLFDDIRWSEIDGAYTYNDPQLGPISVGPGAGSRSGSDSDNGVHFIRHGTYNAGGPETRPRNIALQAIIKY